MDFDDLCATYFSCKTKISHLYEIVIFHFLDSEKEKEAEGGGFGPGAYINGSAVSKTVKSKHSKEETGNSQRCIYKHDRHKCPMSNNKEVVQSTVGVVVVMGGEGEGGGMD